MTSTVDPMFLFLGGIFSLELITAIEEILGGRLKELSRRSIRPFKFHCGLLLFDIVTYLIASLLAFFYMILLPPIQLLYQFSLIIMAIGIVFSFTLVVTTIIELCYSAYRVIR